MTCALMLLLLAGTSVGCVKVHRQNYSSRHNTTVSHQSPWAPHEQIVFEYFSRDGHAVLDSDRVRLIFDDISPAQQQAFHFSGKQQAIQVKGDGASTVTVSSRRNLAALTFKSHYANNTNTLQFGDCSVSFIDGGQMLRAGELAIDLTGPVKTICVSKKGAVVQAASSRESAAVH